MLGIGGQIRDAALEIIENLPEGIRYGALYKAVRDKLPSANPNTIQGNIWDLDSQYPERVFKPARGLFLATRYRSTGGPLPPEGPTPPPEGPIPAPEADFYQPFADWLVHETEECTKAIPLGGNRFREKWGTPDVLGKWASAPSDIIEGPIELVAAEVKSDSNQLITAFGQACAYKLFAHKSYLVVPRTSNQDDISRLDSLCQITGIGLVLFDNTSEADPAFEIRVRPVRHEPDMFYVNKCAKEVERELFQ